MGLGLAVTCELLGAPLTGADVPHLVRYQGQAVDSQGVPLEGPYTLTFRLYDAETAGTKVWEETQTNVPLDKGRFSVLLGQVTPLTLDWSKPLWLSVQVGTDPELAPRQRITSVPLAIVAERLADSQNISPVNLLKDGSFESWGEGPYPILREWSTVSTVSPWDTIKRETGIVRIGQTAAKLIDDSAGHYGNVHQMVDAALLRGHAVTFSVWARSTVPKRPCLDIGDGIGGTSSCTHSGSGAWEYLSVTRMIDPQATQVVFSINGAGDVQNPTYLDGAMAVAGPMPFAFSPNPQDTVDISVHVYNSAALSIANAADTALTFNSEDWDTDAIHDIVTNPGRLTAKTAGKYYIFANVRFAANATGRRVVYLSLNDATTIARITIPAGPATDATEVNLGVHYQMAVNDYVVCRVIQDSGGALNVERTLNSSPVFGMVKLP